VDIPSNKNKMIESSASENKAADSPTTVKAVSFLMNEYFFPGGGLYKPMSIKAATREQAEAAYREKRESITTEEKVEKKEPNNE
jgi:hypothetical protein